MASQASQKLFEKSFARGQHARAFWKPRNDRYGRLLSFCLELQHHKWQPQTPLGGRPMRPTTQRQYNLIRHKVASLCSNKPVFDGHPLKRDSSPEAAEYSRRVVENVFLDPMRGYHETRKRFVISACAGGRGVIGVEWHHRYGPILGFRDPRKVHIAPGFTYMHDLLNPYVFEELTLRESQLARMPWDQKVVRDLVPDSDNPDALDGPPMDTSRAFQRDGWVPETDGDPDDPDDKSVTIWKFHYREDPYADQVAAAREASLPEDQWHFMDDATGDTQPYSSDNPVPPMSQATGQPMRLVTHPAESHYHQNEDGCLCIVAPFGRTKQPLFEGGWTDGAIDPTATLSVFPYGELNPGLHPLRRSGLSDTELTLSLTMLDDATIGQTWEQMNQAGGVMITMAGALQDSQGNQFQFTNRPLSIAYTRDLLAANATKFFQAPGMNPAMPAFRGMIDGEWQFIGTGDFSGNLGADRSKDIAVGTVSLLKQQGDLPLQLTQSDVNLQESLMGRAVLDYCRAYMGDQVISWVSDGGSTAFSPMIRGSDLAPMNIVISAEQEWRQQDSDRVQAQAQLLGMIQGLNLPPQAMIAFLKDAGMSAEALGAITESVNQPPASPTPQVVTAQAAMIQAIAKAGFPTAAIGPLLSDSGMTDQTVQAVMQALGSGMAQQPMAGNGPPTPGGNPGLQLVQGGNPR